MRETLTRGVNQPWGFAIERKSTDLTIRVNRIDNNSPMKYSQIKVNDILISMNGMACSSLSPMLLETLMTNNTSLDISFEKDGWTPPPAAAIIQTPIQPPNHIVIDMTVSDNDSDDTDTGPIPISFRSPYPNNSNVIDLVSDDEDEIVPVTPMPTVSTMMPTMNTSKRTLDEPIFLSVVKKAKFSTPSVSTSTPTVKIKEEFPVKGFGECDIGDEVVEVRKVDDSANNIVDFSQTGDIEYVGGNFQVASDMPHQREACTKFSFSIEASKSINMQHCPNCYCYVCEVKVSNCHDWSRHCFASCRQGKWKSERDSLRSPLAILLSPALKSAALSIVKAPAPTPHHHFHHYPWNNDSDDDEYGYGYHNSDEDEDEPADHNHLDRLIKEGEKINAELASLRSKNIALEKETLVRHIFVIISSLKQFINTYKNNDILYEVLLQIIIDNPLDAPIKAALLKELQSIECATSFKGIIYGILNHKKPIAQLTHADISKIMTQLSSSQYLDCRTAVLRSLSKTSKSHLAFELCVHATSTTSASSDVSIMINCLMESFRSKASDFTAKFKLVCNRISSLNESLSRGLDSALDYRVCLLLFYKCYGRSASHDYNLFQMICTKRELLLCSMEECLESIALIPSYGIILPPPATDILSQLDIFTLSNTQWRAMFFKVVLNLPPHTIPMPDSSLAILGIRDPYSIMIATWLSRMNLDIKITRSLLLLYNVDNVKYLPVMNAIIENSYLTVANRHFSSAEVREAFYLIPASYFQKYLPSETDYLSILSYPNVTSAVDASSLMLPKCETLFALCVNIGLSMDKSFMLLNIGWNTFRNQYTSSILKDIDVHNYRSPDSSLLQHCKTIVSKLCETDTNIFQFRHDVITSFGPSFTFIKESCFYILAGIYDVIQSIQGSFNRSESRLSQVSTLKKIKRSIIAAYKRSSSDLINVESIASYDAIQLLLRNIFIPMYTKIGANQAGNARYFAAKIILEDWTSIQSSVDYIKAMEYIKEDDIGGNIPLALSTLYQSCSLLTDMTVFSSILVRAPHCFLSTLGKTYDEGLVKIALKFMIPSIIRNLVKSLNRDKNPAMKNSFLLLCASSLDTSLKPDYPEALYDNAIEVAAITSCSNHLVALLSKRYSIVAHRQNALKRAKLSSLIEEKALAMCATLNQGNGNRPIPLPLLSSFLKIVSVKTPSLLGNIMPWVIDVVSSSISGADFDEIKVTISSIINLLSPVPIATEPTSSSSSEASTKLKEIDPNLRRSILALKFFSHPILANINDYLSSEPDADKGSLSFYIISFYFIKHITVYDVFQIIATLFPDNGIHDFLRYLLIWENAVTSNLLVSFYEIIDANDIRRGFVLNELLKLLFTIQNSLSKELMNIISSISNKLSTVTVSQDTVTAYGHPKLCLSFINYSEYIEASPTNGDKKSLATFYIPAAYLHENIYHINRINAIIEFNMSTQDRLAIIDFICSHNMNQTAYFSTRPQLQTIKPCIYKAFVNFDEDPNQTILLQKSLFSDDYATLLDIVKDEFISGTSMARKVNISKMLVENITIHSMFPTIDLSRMSSDELYQNEINLLFMQQDNIQHKLLPIMLMMREIIFLDPTSSIKQQYDVFIGKLHTISKFNSILVAVCELYVNYDSAYNFVKCVDTFRAVHQQCRTLDNASASLPDTSLFYDLMSAALACEKSVNGVSYHVIESILKACAGIFTAGTLRTSISWLQAIPEFESFAKYLLSRSMHGLNLTTHNFPDGIIALEKYERKDNFPIILNLWIRLIQCNVLFLNLFNSIIMEELKRTFLKSISIPFKQLIPSLRAYGTKADYVITLIEFYEKPITQSVFDNALDSARNENMYITFVEASLPLVKRSIKQFQAKYEFISSMIQRSDADRPQVILIIDPYLPELITQHDSVLTILINYTATNSTANNDIVSNILSLPSILNQFTVNYSYHHISRHSAGDIAKLWDKIMTLMKPVALPKFDVMALRITEGILEQRLVEGVKYTANWFYATLKAIYSKANESARWLALIAQICKLAKKKKVLENITKIYI